MLVVVRCGGMSVYGTMVRYGPPLSVDVVVVMVEGRGPVEEGDGRDV
jgi:hypothetical protein